MNEAQKALRRAEAAENEALRAVAQHDSSKALAAQAAAAQALKDAEATHPVNAMREVRDRLEKAKAATDLMARNGNNSRDADNAAVKQREALSALRDLEDALAEALGVDREALADERQLKDAVDKALLAQGKAENAAKMAAEAIGRRDWRSKAGWMTEADQAMDRSREIMGQMREACELAGEPRLAAEFDAAREAQSAALAAQQEAQQLSDRFDRAQSRGDLNEAAQAAELKAVAAQAAATQSFAKAAESLHKAMSAREDAAAGEAASRNQSGSQAPAPGESSAGSQSRSGSQAPSPGQSGSQSQADSPAAAAQQAADALSAAAAAMAANLGIPNDARQNGAGQGRGRYRRRQRGGGGGVSEPSLEEELSEELDLTEDGEAGADGNRHWQRIRGSVKEGLGEWQLRNVPKEYRELVRRYFLRISEEELRGK